MKKAVRSRKYFAPQTDDRERRCDHPGCNKPGEYRAPKNRRLKEYYWFCLEHVQEYNAKWNYYEGISTEAPEEEPKRRMHFRGFKSKVKYNFGYNIKDDFGFFGEYATDFAAMDDVWYNEEERRFLQIMELKPGEVSVETLKKQYKKLVKKYHTDVNRDDQNAEEKFKQLTIAYKALLAKFS